MTHDPATCASCCERNSADGLLTPFSPRSVIAKTPSSFTAPKRFLNARIKRNDECVSPSKYRTVSTMCSSTRGPASEPSLVTWPTRISVIPACFAIRVSCAAHSRTCDTDPGADCNCSEYTVWIESTTTTAGLSSSTVAMIRSSEISASSRTPPASSPSRRARNAICGADSSPLM